MFLWHSYRLKLGWPGIWSFGAAVPVGTPGAAMLPVGVVLAETESISRGSASAILSLVSRTHAPLDLLHGRVAVLSSNMALARRNRNCMRAMRLSSKVLRARYE